MISAAILCLVVGVSDGDTLTARCGEAGDYTKLKVRIAAIDAPEKRQPFGQRSRQHLAALCFQQQAIITPKSKDRYGRTVADVECQGQDAAQAQVQAGMAWYYVRYGKGHESLAGLEAEARQERRGLWSVEAVPPWVWRRLRYAAAHTYASRCGEPTDFREVKQEPCLHSNTVNKHSVLCRIFCGIVQFHREIHSYPQYPHAS